MLTVLVFSQAYVQHVIGQQQSSVWELLSKPNCHTYVCGDSSMGEEVKAEVSGYQASYSIYNIIRQMYGTCIKTCGIKYMIRHLVILWPT